MSDWALTTAGDLELTTNDLEFVTGPEAIRQHLEIRLRFLLGEWFLDEREGVPYLQEIFSKGTSNARVLAILRETMIETPGVIEIRELSIETDKAARSASVSAALQVTGSDEPLDFSEVFEVG